MKMNKRLSLALVGILMVLLVTLIFALPALADENEITEVDTWEELLGAVNSDKTHIRLKASITDTVPDDELPTKHRLLFDGGKSYVLDLNGYNLTVLNHANEYYTGNFSMLRVANSSSLEIKNGAMVFENYYCGRTRTAMGAVSVEDSSSLKASRVDIKNPYCGTVIYATDTASVTLDGGTYSSFNGFALYFEHNASLSLEGGVLLRTEMGDSAATVFVDGYGALYYDSEGTLTVDYALFQSGIQVNTTQIDAFSAVDHELTINGVVETESVADITNQFDAKQAEVDYYWYASGRTRCLYRTENSSFVNTVGVISYDKKYPIEIDGGKAYIDGNPVTEVGYGETVTIVANAPAEGTEFLYWTTSGVDIADYYSESTSFGMPPAPVYLASCYGKESIKEINITVSDINAGQRASDMAVTVDNGMLLQRVEWYGNLLLMNENDLFTPGWSYEVKLLIYPSEGNKFGDTLTATLNGKTATVESLDAGYAIISYSCGTLPENPFPVVYNTTTAKLGIGGLLELDTALMVSQSAELKADMDAGTVKYQWYKDGIPIDGENEPIYHFTTKDVGSKFCVRVTIGDKVAWADAHECYNLLYQIYLNVGEAVAGGKAPLLSSLTPGVSIDPESLVICEGYGMPTMDINKTMLIPGKSYLLIGRLVQTADANIPYGANVYVNDSLLTDTVDSLYQFFYPFTIPEEDYPVYYKANGTVGIGATVTVDIERMGEDSSTFKHALEAANPTYQTVFYQWYRNGERIEGATDISYTVKRTDKDSYINCIVTLVDGKYGIGEQYIITDKVTVLDVTMAYPKNGEKRITGAKADNVSQIQIMWWPKETGVTMSGNDTYVEGVAYEYYILFSVADGLSFADAEDRTVFIYGEKATHASGYAYTGEVTAIHCHLYGDNYKSDDYGHWQSCMISGCPCPDEGYEGYVPHWGGGANCKTKGICGQCGAEYMTDHDFSVPDYEYFDDFKCVSYCTTEGCYEYGASWSYHEGGAATCREKAVCEICYHEYGALAPHSYSEEWSKDATHHWHACEECGEDKSEYATHIDENGDRLCDECEYLMPDNTPDKPGNEPPTDNPPSDNPPQDTPTGDGEGLDTGAIIGIVLGAALILGIGGFCLYWFVFRKRTRPI